MSLKKLGLTVVALTYVSAAYANTKIEAQIEAETGNAVAEAPAPAITTQEVYVIQGQEQAQGSTSEAAQKVVTQPTTVVEAAPLIQSQADRLRTARQQAEIETEQKIVEKLEDSRLRDEKRRQQELFGDRLKAKEAAENKAVEAAPVVIQPAPVEKEEKEELPPQIVIIEKDEQGPRKSEAQLKNEIAESVKADLAAINKEEKKISDEGRMNVSAQLGVLEYDAANIDSDFATGASIGWVMDNGVQLEASFLYSNHNVIENFLQFQEFEQYNWTLAAKYSLMKTAIRPVIGGLVGLTQRTYTIPLNPGLGDNSFDSTALDAGLIIGADLKVSDNLVVGVDYRNVINLTTRYENDVNRLRSGFYDGDDIEEIGYSAFTASLRFLF